MLSHGWFIDYIGGLENSSLCLTHHPTFNRRELVRVWLYHAIHKYQSNSQRPSHTLLITCKILQSLIQFNSFWWFINYYNFDNSIHFDNCDDLLTIIFLWIKLLPPFLIIREIWLFRLIEKPMYLNYNKVYIHWVFNEPKK
jgi:hypothetical protein